MKLKNWIAAAALGVMASTASAAQVSLDAISGDLTVKLTGLTTEAGNHYGSNESTWGVGAINNILSTNGSTWAAGGADGKYLYYMIYGIADMGITGSSGNFNIFNVGATGGAGDGLIHLDVYVTNTQIAAIDSTFSAQVAGRTSYSSYNLLDPLGPAWLKLTFSPGLITADDPSTAWDDTLTTLFQTAASSTLPTTGAGAFYADVVGGTDAAKWDTSTVDNHDMYGTFTLGRNGINPRPIPTHGTCSAADVDNNVCFAGYISDPIVANRLPEPASLAIFGLGLAGLAGLRRRKQK